MKRIILLLWVSFFPAFLNAQEDFAPIGAEWYYGIGYGQIGAVGYELYSVEKDTLYKSRECRKINVKRYNHYGEIDKEFTFFTFADTGKVYYSYRDYFYLLFDFNLATGDTFRYPVPYDYVGGSTEYFDSLTIQRLDSIQEIDVDGTVLKKFWLSFPLQDYSGGYHYCYTERVGGCNYFFPYEMELGPYDVHSITFRCYRDYEIEITNIYNQPCDTLIQPSDIMVYNIYKPAIWLNNNSIYIQLNDLNPVYNPFEISIFSVQGILLYQKQFNFSDGTTEIILEKDFKKGIYLIRLTDNYSNISTFKIFLE